MTYVGTSPAPLRKHEVPAAVKTLISTTRMNTLLYGSGRVYTEQKRPTKPEAGDKKTPWGRVVVMLADQLYPTGQALPGREELVSVLTRAEISVPDDGMDYTQALEAILEECFLQLNGVSLTVTKATVVFPLFFHSDVNKRPVWDDENGVWFKTREFRTVLQPVSAEP